MMTDIEIAQSVKARPIQEVAQRLGLTPEQLIPYGHDKAKVDPAAYKDKPGANPADASRFQDGDTASQDVLWAASNGIFSGKDEGRLDASARATRAEGAQALTRLSIFLAQ